MKLQNSRDVTLHTFVCGVLVALLISIFILPTTLHAQTTFDELLAEFQALRDEVESLRTEVQQLRSGSGTAVTDPVPPPEPPAPPAITLGLGDSGDDVRQLQEVLLHLGYDIPAGITGNFLTQTENALRQVQEDNGIPITGVLDGATLEILGRLIDFEALHTPPIEPDETEGGVEPDQPVITPGLRLLAPQNGLSVNSGQTIQIAWDTTYAPAGALVRFKLINERSGIEQTVLETNDLTANYDWTLPTNMPGDNEFVAQLFHNRDDGTTLLLASKTIVFNIFGGTSETTTTNTTTTTTSTNYDSYVTFYTGTEFTTCMADFPETVDLITGWLDSGLLRFEFPWGEITGAAANKVAECEGDEFNDYDNYTEYGDCLDNTTESTCYAQPGCEWFDTFCSGDNYNPTAGPNNSCVGTTKESCTGVQNCYWNTESSYCYYDESGGGSNTTSVTHCFYSGATINGSPAGFTVWCDENNNCREGSESGDQVSSSGLVLGEPSSCYSASSSSSASSGFVATVFNAVSILFQKVFGL